LTVIVKVLSSPSQSIPPFSNTGLTLMTAIIGVLVRLVAVKEEISPLPLLERPILGVLFVQV
jgi:hypothetical protein